MNKKIINHYKIAITLILSILFILINYNVSKGSYSASDATTTVGSNVSISIVSTEGLQNFDISLSNAGGLNFSSVSTSGISNGGSVSYAGLGSPITNLATYTFQAPSTPGTYTVSFNVNGSTVNSTVVVNSASTNTENSSGGSSGNSSTGSSSTGSIGSTGNTSSSSTTTRESDNANLSNLGIRPNDFTGFKPGTTTYNVTVPEDVESVEVYATAQDSGATISGTGNRTLQYGANALNVVVTAEDGTTKTYTINVTREGAEESEEEQPEENTEDTEIINGLSNITIKDLELEPAFSSDVYEYTVDYIGEATSLDIETVATDPSYTVEILGNEELKEGENTITILVSDSEGNNVATYQLTVNKSLVDEEALAREEEQRQQEEQRRMFMIAGGIIALILIIVIIIIIKRRRNRVYAEEFSGVPFAGINNEDDYYDDYNENNQYDDDYDNQIDTQNDQFSSEENNGNYLDENEDAQIKSQDYDNLQEGETLQRPKFLNNQIDDKELQEKERAKQEFLKGYDTEENYDYNDDYEDEKPRKRKKGKRFK